VSELGRYGPGNSVLLPVPLCATRWPQLILFARPSSLALFLGITNYFKFLKWCFWVFVILSVLCFPTLILNTFGRGDEQGGSLNDLSVTMVGNLGDANGTQTVHYPGCNDELRGQK
jgi:hypothetical protein